MSREQPGPISAQLRPDQWVDEHGDYLYRFALARVDSPEAAEDLVQETLLAALKAAPAFAGRSSERTWLTGILKNKLVDWLRQTQRARLVADLQQADECLDGLYNRAGHWKSRPRDWGGDPAKALERREFWEAFQHCLAHLPNRLREVFSLRLLDEVPAAEVCQVWDIPRRTCGRCCTGRGSGCGAVSIRPVSARPLPRSDDGVLQAGGGTHVPVLGNQIKPLATACARRPPMRLPLVPAFPAPATAGGTGLPHVGPLRSISPGRLGRGPQR